MPADNDLIFPNSDGTPWRPSSAKLFRKDLLRVGLPEVFEPTQTKFTFHKLRATFCTLLAQAKVNHDVRASLLGHAPTSTEDGYYHDKLAELREGIDGLSLPVTADGIVASWQSLEQTLEQPSASAPNRKSSEAFLA
jgi:site-specific recombinase XerD